MGEVWEKPGRGMGEVWGKLWKKYDGCMREELGNYGRGKTIV